jgi:chromosome partitioning protein
VLALSAFRAVASGPMADDTRLHAIFIALANQKGGVGKTTLAVNIAAQAARARMQVLGVDTDPQGSMEEIASAAGDTVGFHFAADRNPDELSRLRRVKGLYDLVVMDTAGNLVTGDGSLDATLELVLRAADFCLIPCIPERACLKPTLMTARVARDLGLHFAILINQDDPVRGAGPAADLRAFLAGEGLPVLSSGIRRYSAWPQAQLQGVMMPDYRGRGAPRSAVAAREDLSGVFSEVMALLMRKWAQA